jgi:hypothetical protein
MAQQSQSFPVSAPSSEEVKISYMSGIPQTSLKYITEMERIKAPAFRGEDIVGDEIENGVAFGITPGLFIINQKVDIRARTDPKFLKARYNLLVKTLRARGIQGKIAIPFKFFRVSSLSQYDYKKTRLEEDLGIVAKGEPFNPHNATHIYADEIYFENSFSAMMAKTMIETIIRENQHMDYLPMFNWIIQKLADYDKET